MKRRDFLVSSAAGAVGLGAVPLSAMALDPEPRVQAGKRKILLAGGGFRTEFIRYMAELTGKERPRICYLPTASADSESGTIRFFQYCAPLDVVPFVQNSFISSYRQDQSWEEALLSMDGLVVSHMTVTLSVSTL